MDIKWKEDRLQRFLILLHDFLWVQAPAGAAKRGTALHALFADPTKLAHEPHFFCGSCIKSYGRNLNRPSFVADVQEYINNVIIPYRKTYSGGI